MATIPDFIPDSIASSEPQDAQDSCSKETGSQDTGPYGVFMRHWSFLNQVASSSGCSFARFVPQVKKEAESHFRDGENRHETIDRLLTQFESERLGRDMLWGYSDNQILTGLVKYTVARMKDIAKTRTTNAEEPF